MTPAALVLALAAIGLITWGVGAILAPRRPAKPAASTTMSYRGRQVRLPPARWRGHQGGEGMSFHPVSTLEDLNSLDEADVIAGYVEAKVGDPEPGPNRGRAYWHGWRNAMIDRGVIPGDAYARQLAREFVAAQRSGQQGGA